MTEKPTTVTVGPVAPEVKLRFLREKHLARHPEMEQEQEPVADTVPTDSEGPET